PFPATEKLSGGWFGKDYYKVEFFDQIPPDTWEAIHEAARTGTGYAHYLGAHFNRATNANYYIVPSHNQKYVEWYEVQDKSWLTTIGEWIGELWRAIAAGFNFFIQGVAHVGQVAFAKFLKVANIDPTPFFDAVERAKNLFAKRVGLYTAIVGNTRKFLSNALEGLGQGIKDFFAEETIFKNLKEILVNLFFGDYANLPLPTSFDDLPGFARFGLGLLDLPGAFRDVARGFIRSNPLAQKLGLERVLDAVLAYFFDKDDVDLGGVWDKFKDLLQNV